MILPTNETNPIFVVPANIGSKLAGTGTDSKKDGGGADGSDSRGGSWGRLVGNCRVPNRIRITPNYRGNDLGLRLAL